ncbi:MAG: type I 3-dehydroquinate dehydratase [Lachnospiraceae bacterium]|nr:type I 3-dehydroquinate dehydratase [Lachnospiraceae bacterium]
MSIKIKHIIIGEGIPKICVPLTGRTQKEILQQARAAAEAAPDLVEWRADYWEQIFEPCAIEKTAKALGEILGEIPLLFTFRTASEGGEQQPGPENYSSANLLAAKCEEVSLIDVEICQEGLDAGALIGKLQSQGKITIASNHHFTRTPSDASMREVFARMEQANADIWKLAVMPACQEDVLRLLALTREISSETDHPMITMSMGQSGVLSRVAGELFGSAVTFASVTEASAPGQINIEKMKEILQLLSAG